MPIQPSHPAGTEHSAQHLGVMVSGDEMTAALQPLPLPLDGLRDALTQGHISARYQPVVRMTDRKPVALEVLARLEHPVLGTVQPDHFIPQLEDAGLAWPLTQAVVRRALADWTEYHLQDLGLSLALNFPLDVLLTPEALPWLDNECARAGICPAVISVELTESRPLTRLDDLRFAVAQMRASGHHLAIDDVGPDVRDHRELLDLPFSCLKLDKDLVRSSANSAAAQEFLLQSIAAARAAGLDIIAEGVETEAVWERMAALGIEQAQGYLIARPMPAQDVAAWCHTWKLEHQASG